MVEPRITKNEMPPTGTIVEFKSPYTHYAPPNFDTPHFLYEVQWYERFFPGVRLVISKFYFDSLEQAHAEFKAHQERWFGPLTNPIDTELEKETKKILDECRRGRENRRKAIQNMEDFYPLGLREYMERLRRAKWVKDKRKREKQKIMNMGSTDAAIYIQQQLSKINQEGMQ